MPYYKDTSGSVHYLEPSAENLAGDLLPAGSVPISESEAASLLSSMRRAASDEARNAARHALAESDITVLRCAEAGVPVPQAWRDYRAALRLIVSSAAGDPDVGLPPRPDYPPGT